MTTVQEGGEGPGETPWQPAPLLLGTLENSTGGFGGGSGMTQIQQLVSERRNGGTGDEERGGEDREERGGMSDL